MKALLATIGLIILFSLPLSAWEMEFVVSDEAEITLTVGCENGATDGFDRDFDQVAPPSPPEGFYAYFPLSDPDYSFITSLWSDIRNAEDTLVIWRVALVRPTGGTINWNSSSLPPGKMLIDGHDIAGIASHSYSYPATATQIILEYHKNISPVLESKEIPKKLELSQNYPNPFNSRTKISLSVPGKEGEPVPVLLELYNLAGDKVKTIYSGKLTPGVYSIELDADKLASGVYLYKITCGKESIERKLTVVK
ncbi:T9SS type A sorting domain-containing protein [bacterium]|nr:T9SS type A sorting domain-containing protein [bacterium]